MKNATHITVILDRSGSMASIRKDAIGGFNQFLKEQQDAPGDCTLTLVQFDTQNAYEVLRDMEAVKNVKPLGDEYQPRAGTPLYDAVGRGIVDTGEKLSALAADQRPDKVVFVILTDGEDNSSFEYSKARVAEMTTEQTEKYNWQFVYLGANQDSMKEGAKFGVSMAMAASYAPANIMQATAFASSNVAQYRCSNKSSDLTFTDEQRSQLTGGTP